MRIVALCLEVSICEYTFFLHITVSIQESHAAVNLQASSDGDIQET